MSEIEDLIARVSRAVEAHPPSKKSVLIDFMGQGVMRIADGKVTREDEPSDVRVTATPENLIALAKGQLDPLSAVLRGKVKVKGDMGAILALRPLLSGSKG